MHKLSCALDGHHHGSTVVSYSSSLWQACKLQKTSFKSVYTIFGGGETTQTEYGWDEILGIN